LAAVFSRLSTLPLHGFWQVQFIFGNIIHLVFVKTEEICGVYFVENTLIGVEVV
jgi:hypothetical protein